MAYFTSIWKARIIEKCRQEYENEKINSLLTSKTDIPQKTIMQRWRFYGQNTKRRMTGHLKKWFPDGSSVSNLYFYLKSDHALPRFVLKSFIGFVCGIVLTYLCFIFFVFQLSISLIHATIMSSIIGVLLTLGLAFSCRIRSVLNIMALWYWALLRFYLKRTFIQLKCLIFLLIPQLFSRVGRYTLTCYALVLILTGPATNTLKNSEVLTESMACSQEQIKTNVRHISETVKKPFNAMKESIKLMVDEMKRVTSEMNIIISKISVMVTSIADLIQSSYSWLNSVANICHQTFGTPYDRCLKSIERGARNYMKTAGKDFVWHFNDSAANSACLAVKSYKTVCVVSDYATTSYAATLKRRLRNYITRINTTFCINVQIHHTYSYSSNESSTPNQMAAGIVTEIRKRADPLLTWLSWSSCITSLFLMLIIFRAKYYQHMFETRSRYDNRYVTKELRDLDFKRYQERRETVLPLNRRERAKYICISSFRLVSSEKVYLTRSIIFMAITTFKLLIHMVADYSLYWVLITIRHHGRLQTPLSLGPSDAGVHVSGSGIVRDFIKSLLDSITAPLLSQRTIKVNCLPNPYPPDLQRYTQIAILIILLWFFALFEPYGLRFRHVIVGHYQPDRAKTRAVWLYNHIIRTRGSFMKLARRKLHREYKYSNHENQTFRYWLDSILPCWYLRYMFGTLPKEPHCLLCKTFEEQNDYDTKLTNCDTLNCPGVYCLRCFSDIGRLCTICLSPKDYGDMSDVSLEKGSSDESDTDECKERGTERERLIKKRKSEQLNMSELASEKMKNGSNEGASVLPDIGRYEDVNKRNGSSSSSSSNNNSITNTYTVNGYYGTENYKDTENENPIQNDITRQYENKSKFDEDNNRLTSIESSKYNNVYRNKTNSKRPVKKLKPKRQYRIFLHRKSKVRVHEKRHILGNIISQYLRRSQEQRRIHLFDHIKIRAKSIKVCKLKYQTRIAKYLKLRHKLRNKTARGRKIKSTIISNENDKCQKYNKISYRKRITQRGYYIAIKRNGVFNSKRSRINKNSKKSFEKHENCKQSNIKSSRQNINVFLKTCFNYYRTLKSISSSRKLYNIRNNNKDVLTNQINFKCRKTIIKNDVNDKTNMNNNPINRIYTYLFENNWFKVKLLKDRNEVLKSTNTSELEERVKEDKSNKPKIHKEHEDKIATPRSKLTRPFHLYTCAKKSDKSVIVYEGDNELKITKEFSDPVNDNNNNDEEVNASGVTLSTFSLSYDTKTYTNTTTVDYQESPKCVQAVGRKGKVKGDSKDGLESTQSKVSNITAKSNDWWSPILERTNVKEHSRRMRVE